MPNSIVIPPVPRSSLVDTIADTLTKSRMVVLRGPNFRGKTTLIEQVRLRREGAGGFAGVITIDFFALRRPDPDALERQTLRWLTADEEKYQHYLSTHKKDALSAYLKEHLGTNGLLILDHLDFVLTDSVRESWLVQKLISTCLKAGAAILACMEGVFPTMQGLPDTLKYLAVPPLSEDEVSEWFALPAFPDTMLPEGITPARVIATTAGLIGQVRDFILYLTCNVKRDWVARAGLDAVCENFIRDQAALFSPTCFKALEACLQHPEESPHFWESSSPELTSKLLASGAFVMVEDRLEFSAPVFCHRLKRLLAPRNFLAALSAHDDDWFRHHNDWTIKKDDTEQTGYPLEIVVQAFVRHCANLHDHRRVFTNVCQFFQNAMRTEVRAYVVDITHARIWHHVGSREARAYFVAQPGKDPALDFALRCGRRSITEVAEPYSDHSNGDQMDVAPPMVERIYLPLVGSSGVVEIIFRAQPHANVRRNRWIYAMYIRRLWYVLQALQPVLAEAARVHSLELVHQQYERLTYRVDGIEVAGRDFMIGDALRESQADAMCLLQRLEGGAGRRMWMPLSVSASTPLAGQNSFPIREWHMRGAADDQLDQICSHPSRRGLVVVNSSAIELFPRLHTLDGGLTLFVKPAVIAALPDGSSSQKMLLVFVFRTRPGEGGTFEETSVPLSGAQQHFISVLARRVAEAHYQRCRMLVEYGRHLKVLDRVNQIITRGVREPETPERAILREVQDCFKVSAISLSDVVTVQRGDKLEREVRIREQIGYDGNYNNIVYRPGTEDEGKTGYIVRTGTMVVYWRDEGENVVQKYTWNAELAILEPISEDSRGWNRCKRFLPEQDVQAFVGVPIRLPGRAGSEIIGVLKMANRTQGPQRFDIEEIAAIHRLASILGSALYQLRHGHACHRGRVTEGMRILYEGIAHGLKGPMSILAMRAASISRDVHDSACPDELAHPLREAAESIDEEVHRMNRMLDAIKRPFLDGLNPAATVQIDAEQVILQVLADHPQVHYDRSFAPLLIEMGEVQLITVLENLVINALEAIANVPGGQVMLKAERSNGAVVIEVRDNGPGVPKHLTGAKMYEPGRSGRVGPNRGFGLYLALCLSNNAGGEIMYDRQEQLPHPTCFRLTFPDPLHH